MVAGKIHLQDSAVIKITVLGLFIVTRASVARCQGKHYNKDDPEPGWAAIASV